MLSSSTSGGNRAQNRFPSRTISAVVANQRIGTAVRIRTLINLARQIDARDYLRIIFRIADLQKLPLNFAQQRIGLRTGIDNPVTFAPAHIQIQARSNPSP